MRKYIFEGILMTIASTFLAWVLIAGMHTTHKMQAHQLTNENISLAQDYQKLVQQHKKLNQQYVEKHGYVSQHTNTQGALFIVPYGSHSNSKIEIHTPAMVKIEYQQQAIKTKFNHNNQKLMSYNAPTVDLHDYQETLANQSNNKWLHVTANILLVIIILVPIILWVSVIGELIYEYKHKTVAI